jgi:hypothetical protein
MPSTHLHPFRHATVRDTRLSPRPRWCWLTVDRPTSNTLPRTLLLVSISILRDCLSVSLWWRAGAGTGRVREGDSRFTAHGSRLTAHGSWWTGTHAGTLARWPWLTRMQSPAWHCPSVVSLVMGRSRHILSYPLMSRHPTCFRFPHMVNPMSQLRHPLTRPSRAFHLMQHTQHAWLKQKTENRTQKTENRKQKAKHKQRAETRFLTSANVNKASLPMLSSSAVLNASLSLPCIVTKHAPPGYQPTP